MKAVNYKDLCDYINNEEISRACIAWYLESCGEDIENCEPEAIDWAKIQIVDGLIETYLMIHEFIPDWNMHNILDGQPKHNAAHKARGYC